MKCPVCIEAELVMTERQGVEIDYCPKCRGVWLDRGELDKLIERGSQQFSAPAAVPQGHLPPPVPPQYSHQQGYRRDYDDDDDDDRYKHKKRRRGGFLGEIFDFD